MSVEAGRDGRPARSTPPLGPATEQARALGSLQEVDDEFLAPAFGLPSVPRIGGRAGGGHMSHTCGITLNAAPGPTVILKIRSADPRSRTAVARHRAYEVGSGSARSHRACRSGYRPCHRAGVDPAEARYTIVLEAVARPRAAIKSADASRAKPPAHWPSWRRCTRSGDARAVVRIRSLVRPTWMRRYATGYRPPTCPAGGPGCRSS